MPTMMSPVKPVARVWTAPVLVAAPVTKVAGTLVQPEAAAVKLTMREKPAAGTSVALRAVIGVASIVIVLRDEQKAPCSVLVGTLRLGSRKPVEVSINVPTANTPSSLLGLPLVQKAGTLPSTGKGPATADVGVVPAAPARSKNRGAKAARAMISLRAFPRRRRGRA